MDRIEKILKFIRKPLTWFVVIFILLSLSVVQISYSTLTDDETNIKKKFFASVVDKLIEKKVDTAFINMVLASPNTKFNEKYVKINVISFLSKTAYTSHYNNTSIKKSLNFLRNNMDVLSECELRTNIPKEVITSILWIETKHGNYLGRNHIPSVYFSTAMATNQEYISKNKEFLRNNFDGDDEELKQLEEKIEKRAIKKANWAIDEIIALEKIYKDGKVDILNLYGSWAGAFGMSQFLPSSYANWAVDGNGDGIINLFETEDAIYSVANYLKVNGWGDSTEQQRKAVFHYNNSNAYVDAVLLLAEKIKRSQQLSTPLNEQIKEIQQD